MFDDFWAAWPHKKSKHAAQKAFLKLKPDDQRKATERAARWAAEWRKENPQASHIHAATYLNKKRFLDLDEQNQVRSENDEGVMEMQAGWIRDGKHFLTSSISAVRAAQLVERKLVTIDECREVGLI